MHSLSRREVTMSCVSAVKVSPGVRQEQGLIPALISAHPLAKRLEPARLESHSRSCGKVSRRPHLLKLPPAAAESPARDAGTRPDRRLSFKSLRGWQGFPRLSRGRERQESVPRGQSTCPSAPLSGGEKGGGKRRAAVEGTAHNVLMRPVPRNAGMVPLRSFRLKSKYVSIVRAPS